jgi:4-oxalocrotonate tautomerase
MPHVVVKLYPGAPEEQKRKLAEEITRAFVTILNKPEKSVSIAIEEVAQNEWMEKVYDTEITPNMDRLYKKPGY